VKTQETVLFHINPNPNPKSNPITNLTLTLTITSSNVKLCPRENEILPHVNGMNEPACRVYRAAILPTFLHSHPNPKFNPKTKPNTDPIAAD